MLVQLTPKSAGESSIVRGMASFWATVWYLLNAPEGGLAIFGLMVAFGTFVVARYLIRVYITGQHSVHAVKTTSGKSSPSKAAKFKGRKLA